MSEEIKRIYIGEQKIWDGVALTNKLPTEFPLTQFSVDGRIELTRPANIRSDSDITASLLGINLRGWRGTIVDGPEDGPNGTNWFKVDFDRGAWNGWVVDDNFKNASSEVVRTPNYFKVGNAVTLFRSANLRSNPVIDASNLIGTVAKDKVANITDGPVKDGDNNIWYKLDFYDVTTEAGWVASDNYVLANSVGTGGNTGGNTGGGTGSGTGDTGGGDTGGGTGGALPLPEAPVGGGGGTPDTTVSSSSALSNAIRSASNGDLIHLAGGNYGNLTIAGINKTVHIASASTSNPAKFSQIKINNCKGLVIDRISFNSRVFGIVLDNSENVTIQNSSFNNHEKGIATSASKNVRIINNSFSGCTNDAMSFNAVHGVLISGNKVRNMNVPPGSAHNDVVQVFNTKGASSNVTVKNNDFRTNDGYTQVMYFGQNSNINGLTVENNTVYSGHVYGIRVHSPATNVSIKNNIVVRDTTIKENSNYKPVIYVHNSSKNVTITGNTTHGITSPGNTSNNTIVPVGWKQ